MKKILFATLTTISLLFASLLFANPALAKCKSTTDIAEMNWASGQVVAEVIGFIIETGYGCDAELISTSTVPGITSMSEKGTPHINPEAWVNSIKVQVEAGIANGTFVDAGDMFSEGGVEAFWIPAYMSETHPNIKTAKDLYDNPQVFQDPEDPSKGRFYGCPPGWACRIIGANIARAHNLDEKFNIFDPGSAESLKASLAKAYARKEPWVGYYWSPTAALGKFPMKQVDLGAYNEEGHACNQKEDCANPYPGAFPVARIAKLITADYAKANPDIAKFVMKAT
ncbi:MAG: ABC transporter substrate-binding protein, partial [Alphaproteobacteria bacterium]|nr:ABC transporter substrate-binding protein [Alphaproteobacteria bacterium]